MSTDWYLAPALQVLRTEVDARWPDRDRTTDGTIGDQAHQATRSDHNPNARGSVNAWDMDRDGVDVPAVLAAFERHPSAHYWIWQRQIADADDGWRPRPYTGPSPHTEHVHLSIRQTRTAEQDRRPWGLLPVRKEIEMIRIKAKDGKARWLSNGAHIESMELDAALAKAGVPLVEVDTTEQALSLLPPAQAAPELDYDQLAEALLRAMANPTPRA